MRLSAAPRRPRETMTTYVRSISLVSVSLHLQLSLTKTSPQLQVVFVALVIFLMIIDRDRIFASKNDRLMHEDSQPEAPLMETKLDALLPRADLTENAISDGNTETGALISSPTQSTTIIGPPPTILMRILLGTLNESHQQLLLNEVHMRSRPFADEESFSSAQENNAITTEGQASSVHNPSSRTTDSNLDKSVATTEHSLFPPQQLPPAPTMDPGAKRTTKITRMPEISGNEFITNLLPGSKYSSGGGVGDSAEFPTTRSFQPPTIVNRIGPDKGASKAQLGRQVGHHVTGTLNAVTYPDSKLFGGRMKGAFVESSTKKPEKRDKKLIKRMTRFFLCNSPVLIDMLEQIQNEIIDDV